jgi:hypothetical protein
MFKRGTSSKTVAIATIIALQLISIPALAQSSAVLDGTVLRADRATPIAGAKIHLADVRTGEFVGSAPTDQDGSFHLEALPGGEYDIAVEADGGLYMIPTPLTLKDGETQRVHLAVQPDAVIAKDPNAADNRNKLSFKNNPLTATLMLLGGLTILGWAINEFDDDDPAPLASPS